METSIYPNPQPALSRQQRRARERQQHKRYAGALRDDPFVAVGRIAAESLARDVAHLPPQQRPLRLAERASETLAQLTKAHFTKTAQRPACRKGCSACCELLVGVTLPEALRIARFINAMPEAERAAVIAKVIDVDRVTRGLGAAARFESRHRCPLLDDEGVCVVYPVRPLACQGHASTRPDICATDGESNEGTILELFGYRSALQAAVQAVEIRFGCCPSRMAELNAALATLFLDPTAEARWLAGGSANLPTGLEP